MLSRRSGPYRDDLDQRSEADVTTLAADVQEAAGGWAWLLALSATWLFASGALLLALVVVTGEGGSYGVMALIALFVCELGVATLGVATVLWAVNRLRYRSAAPGRMAATVVVLAAAVALLAPAVANLLGWPVLPGEAWPVPVGGVSLLALAAVLGAGLSERRPTLVFAAVWVMLLATLAYRNWTDLRVQVVWLGPSVINRTPGQIGFTATRSGDFEVRFGAHTCWDGRLIATGRYEWRPDHPGSSFGTTTWVDLPADVLPVERGELVRVCVRDGMAAGAGAGEAGDPPSFWPLD
jgi:hypothetical protein